MALCTEERVPHTEAMGMGVDVSASHPTLCMHFILLVCPALSFSSSAVSEEYELFGALCFGPCSLRWQEEFFSAGSRVASSTTKSILCLKMCGANTLQWWQSLRTTLTPYWYFLLEASGLVLVWVFCAGFLVDWLVGVFQSYNKLHWLENCSDLICIARLFKTEA